MATANGTQATIPSPEARFEALKTGVRKIVDRVATKPNGEPSRISRFATVAVKKVKEHPIAAAAFGLGLAYVTVRIVRRARR